METNSAYTQQVIKGIKYSKMLPEGTALVLEGGGTRGFYSSGVFEAFMDEGIMFPYIAGVSAGAANALTYIAGRRRRSRVIVEKYVGDPRYVSRRNLIRVGSMFGYEFIFNTIPEKHIFWDREVFDDTNIRFLTGATDCATGRTAWFEKSDIDPDLSATRASCAIPVISKKVKYREFELLDGGMSAPIPIEKSIKDGNSFHVVILTRNQGYEKPPFRYERLVKFIYRNYPNLIKAMINRHEIYNRQLEICEELEREGNALIIRPLKPLSVDSSTAVDIPKLLDLYDEGHEEGRQAVKMIMEKLKENPE